jgi:hypothetical protein
MISPMPSHSVGRGMMQPRRRFWISGRQKPGADVMGPMSSEKIMQTRYTAVMSNRGMKPNERSLLWAFWTRCVRLNHDTPRVSSKPER